MSSNVRFGANVDIYYNVMQTGPDAASVINTQVGAINQYNVALGTANQGAMMTAMSMRRLALDFRLLSTSIRTVTRELGISEGAIAMVSSAAVILASTATGVISAWNIYTRLTTTAAKTTIAFSVAIKALAAQFIAFLASIALYLVIIAAIIVAILALNWAFERATGIEAYRNQLKGLEESLKDTENAMKALRAEQSALKAETAGLSKEEADLEAQFKAGLITEEQLNKAMENLAVRKALNSAESAGLALNEAILSDAATQAKYKQEQLQQAIEETRGEALGQIWQQITSPFTNFVNRITEVAPGGAGVRGDINLTVSLAGANIYGSEGVEEALSAGSQRIKNELEYMRRPRVNQGIR